MPVIYNDKKLIPAPSVEVSKEYVKTGDGKKVGTTFSIVLEGQIIAHMGSPDSTGAFHEATGHPDNESITASKIQKSLFRKTEAIRALFATEGKKLEITHWDGADDTATTGFYGYPRVTSISFPSNFYSSILPYTITLELDELEGNAGAEDASTANVAALLATEEGNTFTNNFGNGGSTKIYLSSVTEDWSVSSTEQAKGVLDFSTGAVDETPTYTLNHNTTAVGKRAYDSSGLIKEPWEHAKIWVDSRAGLPVTGSFPVDSSTTGELFTASDAGFLIGTAGSEYFGYNHVKSVSVDKAGGTYSVQETWVLAQKGAYDVSEQMNVEVTENESNMEGIDNVVLSGTITGFEIRNNDVGGNMSSVSQSKYSSASAKFGVLTDTVAASLASTASGITVTTPHLSKSVTRSKSSGVISYSYTFNTRTQSVSNSLTETGSFQENPGNTKYAVIEIPNRSSGPIVQSLGTKNLATATATASVTMGQGHRSSSPSPSDTVFYNLCGIPAAHAVRGSSTTHTIIVTSDQETYEPQSGRWSRTKSWQISEDC